jgi:ribosomal protein S18 acetylase RimI-like enzyme
MALDFGDGYRLRHATAADHTAMNLVCLRTGDAGADATAREDDPELLGLIYAVPYAVHSARFAYVVDGPKGVCGYILGALKSASFYWRLKTEWFPRLAEGLRDPGPDESRWAGSDWARHAIHNPSFVYPPALFPYPAHGHIDLLPEARGRNIGRRGMRHLMASLREAGAPGMHLQVSPRNHGAQSFYRKLGFSELRDESLPGDTTFMVTRLT